MTPDDPFATPDDERTFIMPTPGQRGVGARPPAARYPVDDAAAPATGASVEDLIPSRGINPLVAAASPLLNSVPPLRQSTVHRDPAALRETLAAGIRAFEASATRSGASAQNVLAARYILCTFLDEMAASTPWGGSGVWAQHSLLVLFHNETSGGEKVFQLLARLAENPAANRDLLELMDVVLALGFEGRYRTLPNGKSQLDQLRERLYAMVQGQRTPYERELSPHWQGVQLQRATLLQLPMWVVFALGGMLAVGLYLALSASLNQRSDPVYAGIQAIRAKAGAPLPPPAPPPAARPRLATLLAQDIQAGSLTVADRGDRSIVTLRGDGLFEPGGTSVAAGMQPLFDRIGKALATLPGKVLVTGHTDNQPIHSARFPSNWHLSQQRAEAVRGLLAATVPADRLQAEGRADTEPVAGNATAADRAKNRRVEITLFVTKGAA